MKSASLFLLLVFIVFPLVVSSDFFDLFGKNGFQDFDKFSKGSGNAKFLSLVGDQYQKQEQKVKAMIKEKEKERDKSEGIEGKVVDDKPEIIKSGLSTNESTNESTNGTKTASPPPLTSQVIQADTPPTTPPPTPPKVIQSALTQDEGVREEPDVTKQQNGAVKNKSNSALDLQQNLTGTEEPQPVVDLPEQSIRAVQDVTPGVAPDVEVNQINEIWREELKNWKPVTPTTMPIELSSQKQPTNETDQEQITITHTVLSNQPVNVSSSRQPLIIQDPIINSVQNQSAIPQPIQQGNQSSLQQPLQPVQSSPQPLQQQPLPVQSNVRSNIVPVNVNRNNVSTGNDGNVLQISPRNPSRTPYVITGQQPPQSQPQPQRIQQQRPIQRQQPIPPPQQQVFPQQQRLNPGTQNNNLNGPSRTIVSNNGRTIIQST